MKRRAQLHAFVSHLTEKTQWQRILSLPKLRSLALDFFEARVMPRGRYSVLQSELIQLLTQHYMYTRSTVIPFSPVAPREVVHRARSVVSEKDGIETGAGAPASSIPQAGDRKAAAPEFRPYFPQPLLSVIFDTVVGEAVPMIHEGLISALHPHSEPDPAAESRTPSVESEPGGDKKKKKKKDGKPQKKPDKKAAKKQEKKK